MEWQSECAAIIPCLNEEARVGAVVRAVRSHLRCVLVVDDGSADRTAASAQAGGAQVLRHPGTRGKGAALISGFSWAREHGFHWVLMLDGDGQHSPGDIPGFFACAQRTGASLVVGSRMHEADRMPWLRRLVNQWMTRQLSRIAGHPLPDSQSGYRLMNLDAWSHLQVQASHFEIESELLLAFVAAGHVVESVPIQVIYRDERSKIRPLRDTIRWFRWWRHARAALARANTARPRP